MCPSCVLVAQPLPVFHLFVAEGSSVVRRTRLLGCHTETQAAWFEQPSFLSAGGWTAAIKVSAGCFSEASPWRVDGHHLPVSPPLGCPLCVRVLVFCSYKDAVRLDYCGLIYPNYLLQTPL